MKIEEKDFVEIINQTKKYVFSAIRKYLFDDFFYVIDDIAQETYIRVYKALCKDKFKNHSSLKTYAYKIAKNETLRMNKKMMKEEKKKRNNYNKYLNRDELIIYFDFKENENEKDNLKNKINNLPDKYSKIFNLLLEGESVKNISKELELKIGTVKSLIYRGKLLLLDLLRGDER